MRNSIGPISLGHSAVMTSVAFQLMWWKVTFVFILFKISHHLPFKPPFLRDQLQFVKCKLNLSAFLFGRFLVPSLFVSGSIISSDREKTTYFIFVHLPVFVLWFYVWVLYNFLVIFIKWHLLYICVCLYLDFMFEYYIIFSSFSLNDIYWIYMCLFNLLPVPKTSGCVALYHWKMFMLAMLTLPPIYH